MTGSLNVFLCMQRKMRNAVLLDPFSLSPVLSLSFLIFLALASVSVCSGSHWGNDNRYYNMFSFYCFKDEKNQLLITNTWLKLVSY